MPLGDDEIEAIDRRIQRAGAANCWTGTLGTLATDARRLVRHIQEASPMSSDHPLRITVTCDICKGIAGLLPTCPRCNGVGTVWKRSSPSEPWKYADEDPPYFRPGFDREEYEKRARETEAAAEIASQQPQYPADHILRGEAELRRTQYLGDEMDILTEEDAAEVKEETRKAADLGGGVVPAVDEVASRKAAALAGGEPIRPGTDAFLGVLQEIAALHIRKSKDYGVDEDALANIRAGGEAIGVDPWKGCVLRISDKMQRLKAFCRRGECEFDGVEDTLADIAAYAAIALVMFREASAPPPG